MALDAREAADQRRSVQRFEFVEERCVDEPREDLAHVVAGARIARDEAVDLARVVGRRLGIGLVAMALGRRREVRHDGAHDRERVLVVVRVVIGDARDARVHVGAAEFLGAHDFAGRRLHERRAAQEDRAVPLDDDGLVRHRRHVRAAGRARTHDRGDLRDPLARHARLVVEDASEVVDCLYSHLCKYVYEDTGYFEIRLGNFKMITSLGRTDGIPHP